MGLYEPVGVLLAELLLDEVLVRLVLGVDGDLEVECLREHVHVLDADAAAAALAQAEEVGLKVGRLRQGDVVVPAVAVEDASLYPWWPRKKKPAAAKAEKPAKPKAEKAAKPKAT